MQGQRQQVALQFGVNVFTIERLVRRQERKRRRSVPHDFGIHDVDRPDEKE
jgi:hypothetical protein